MASRTRREPSASAPRPLINSQRRLFKSTYRPLLAPDNTEGSVFAKIALLRGLDVQPAELAQLPLAQPASRRKRAAAEATSLVDVVKGLSSGVTFRALKTYGPALAKMTTQQLVAFGESVAKLRSSLAKQAEATLAEALASGKRKKKKDTAELNRIAAVLPPIASTPLTAAVAAARTNNLPAILQQRASMATAASQGFTYNAQPQRAGWLDLERLEMYPAGVEHGELVHSVPLAPNQTVNITHREWTVTSQTYESMVSDSLDGFSETGVTDKTDLAQTVDTESKHTSALDVNGSVSASYNGGVYSVTASTAVGYQQASENSQALRDSITHSMTTTRTASTRAKKEHKQSFRVSSIAGAEDQAVSIITNPSATNAMRVDYFQLLRKWQVDLVRYGVRMTYDLVIPNPGLDLITRSLEIQAIDEMLTTSTYSFDLTIDEVSEDQWLTLSQKYGVALDQPPAASLALAVFKSLDPIKDGWVSTDVEVDVPDGYALDSGTMAAECHLHVTSGNNYPAFASVPTGPVSGSGGKYDVSASGPLDTLKGATGHVYIPFGYINSDSGSINVTGTAKRLDSVLHAWQLKAWAALRDADLAGYQQRLQAATDRKTYLQDQISQFDALTLRKMEREEIMRWVLRWLFGPSFDLMPPELQNLFTKYPDPNSNPPPPANTVYQDAYPDVSKLDGQQWQDILGFGELIKYLHDAIEWENVLFFAYPYFWDSTKNWPLKRFLLHPDPVHRDFLRSGAMRVVLTIRPGYETSFANLYETGDPGTGSYPYVSIATEIQDFAKTNYYGIPPANPDHNVRPLLYPLQQRAWADMKEIIQAIEAYNDANGKYPGSLSDLPSVQPPLSFIDPWNRPYQYKSPGDYGNYDLVCYGADGVPESKQADPVKQADPLNADITNYAEGSIVARWYEYTPTSAMDISINTVLPTTPTAV